MPMYSKTLSYSLIAAVANGIAQSQAGTANTKLNLNGSLTSGGVATFDNARRVIITSAGNDSGITFMVVGTDRYGRPQTEVITGGNIAAAQSTKNFLTVTSIIPSGNTASTVTAGTNGVGSTAPMICDWFSNGNQMGCTTSVIGTVNYTIEEARDDLAPAWDIANNTVTWSPDPTFTALSTGAAGDLPGPFTMVRLTINSGTGTATAKILTPARFGAI